MNNNGFRNSSSLSNELPDGTLEDAADTDDFDGEIIVNPRIVICNWKMNGDTDLLEVVFEMLKDYRGTCDIVVCPPSIYTQLAVYFRNDHENQSLFVGGQCCSGEISGAFTGSVSAKMLYDVDCDYVIIGHSEERKALRLEFDDISKRLLAAKQNDMAICLCVGEAARGNGVAGIVNELRHYFDTKSPWNSYIVPNELQREIVVAYEPVWAIGTGVVPTDLEISKATTAIRATMMQLGFAPSKYRVAYGGSVNASNVANIIANCGIDGVVLGRPSIVIEELADIIYIIDQTPLKD